MKKILILTLVALLSCSVYAAKQTPTAKVTNVDIKEKENNVTISFNAVVPEINSNYKLTATPILYNDSTSQTLTPIVVAGRTRRIMDKRLNLQPSKSIQAKEKQEVYYRVNIPYQEWMNEVSLQLKLSLDGCCKTTQPLATIGLVANQLIHYDVEPEFNIKNVEPELTELQKFDNAEAFLYPAIEYEKRREIFEQQRERGALTITFPQGGVSIDPSYKNNRQVLAQVNKALDLILADPYASLKRIVIVGLSSPEGSLAKNDILAQKRANSLKEFVYKRVKYATVFQFMYRFISHHKCIPYVWKRRYGII